MADQQARVVAAPVTAVDIYNPPTGISKTNEVAASILGERVKAEVQARTIVALNRPRNFDLFRSKVLAACKRGRFAESAMYSKPIAGKDVVGLSIRFAEECARHYGNLDIKAIPVSEDEERRVFDVIAVDLETNTAFTTPVIVPKAVWRLNPRGEKPIRSKLNARNQTTFLIPADDDSLLTLQSNMLAKAQREVVLKHIPSDVKEEAIETIVATEKLGIETDPEGEKKKIIDAFFEAGVMPNQLAEFLGRPEIGRATPAEIMLLRRAYRGIRDEGATWADVMEARGKMEPATSTDQPATTAPATGAAAGLKSALAATPTPAAKTDQPAKVLVATKDCPDCGVKKGEPHKDACPQV